MSFESRWISIKKLDFFLIKRLYELSTARLKLMLWQYFPVDHKDFEGTVRVDRLRIEPLPDISDILFNSGIGRYSCYIDDDKCIKQREFDSGELSWILIIL